MLSLRYNRQIAAKNERRIEMSKTGIAVLTFSLVGAVTLCSGFVWAQNGQNTTRKSCRAIYKQPEKRLMKMERSLNLTEEQKTKIRPILDEESAKIKAMRDESSLTREQKRAKVKEIHSATYEQVKPILTAEQQQKHDEMLKSTRRWHKKGRYAVSATKRLERMNRTLNLTEEQKSKITPILEKESAKIKAVFDDQSLTRQEKRDKVREIHSASYEQIKPLLTPEQQKKHDDMVKCWKSIPKQDKAGNQS
jgi:Spy/CpxP family protein refolding chaperone